MLTKIGEQKFVTCSSETFTRSLWNAVVVCRRMKVRISTVYDSRSNFPKTGYSRKTMTNPLTMKRSVLGLLIGALFLSGCAVQMPDMKTMAEEAAPGAWSVSIETQAPTPPNSGSPGTIRSYRRSLRRPEAQMPTCSQRSHHCVRPERACRRRSMRSFPRPRSVATLRTAMPTAVRATVSRPPPT